MASGGTSRRRARYRRRKRKSVYLFPVRGGAELQQLLRTEVALILGGFPFVRNRGYKYLRVRARATFRIESRGKLAPSRAELRVISRFLHSLSRSIDDYYEPIQLTIDFNESD